MPRFSRRQRRCRRRRDGSLGGGIWIGVEVLRRLRGPHSPSIRRRWLAFALPQCCSSPFRFSRLKPTPAEALAGTVGALAAMAALRDAGVWALPRVAEAWVLEARAPSAWRVSAGR